MSVINEATGAKPPLASDLAAGVEQISANETVTFTLYQQAVLPLDGYVFWVKVAPVQTVEIQGSFHYSSDTLQEAQENYTLNRVIFTALKQIDNFNDIAPNQLWIAEYLGLTFAFTARGPYYVQADLWHYVGNAVYPDMLPQILPDSSSLQPSRAIVSNSLPLWLALNAYVPPNAGVGLPPGVTLFPSFLSPPNQPPAYGVVDIPPRQNGVMNAPLLDNLYGQAQLVTETVEITLWGLRDDQAQTFILAVQQYSLAFNTFGIMNVPVARDERRTQSELGTLAQKKTVEFEINYYQSTARSIARQLIETVNETFIPTG